MEIIVGKEQMESLKALAETNLKLSEAKNLLFKLQEEETAYLQAREKKALDRIKKTVEESRELVRVAEENHSEIKNLYIETSNFAENLVKLQEDFKLMLESFEERNISWEKDIGKQQDDIAQIKKEMKIEKLQIENDIKSLERSRQKLEEDQKKLKSDRGTIERAIKRLKENRI